MVDVFNTRVTNQGIDADEMKAVCVDLKGTEDELEGVKFDVALVSSCPRLSKSVSLFYPSGSVYTESCPV